MRQFGLHYRDKAQGVLGSLVATPSLLSRVIESQGQDTEKGSSGTGYNQVPMTKAGPLTWMVVFSIWAGLWFPGWQRSSRSSIGLVLLYIQVAQRCTKIFVANITRVE